MVFSEEHKEKLKQAALTRWANPDFKSKRLAAMQSLEYRERRSAVQKGPGKQEQASQKQKEHWKDPVYREAQTKAVREALSNADYSRRKTPEHRAALSASLKGKPKSEEHKAKLKASRSTQEYRLAQRQRSLVPWTDPVWVSAQLAARQSEDRRVKLIKAWEDGRHEGSLRPEHRYTALAQLLHRALSCRGFNLIPEVRFGRYHVDLYSPDLRLAFEADGHYMHFTEAGQLHDKKRDHYLEENFGVVVIRLTKKDIVPLFYAEV